VTAVRAFGQPFRQLFYVVTGQVTVARLAGQLQDGLRAQAAIQVIMQQDLRNRPDLVECQHSTIVLLSPGFPALGKIGAGEGVREQDLQLDRTIRGVHQQFAAAGFEQQLAAAAAR